MWMFVDIKNILINVSRQEKSTSTYAGVISRRPAVTFN